MKLKKNRLVMCFCGRSFRFGGRRIRCCCRTGSVCRFIVLFHVLFVARFFMSAMLTVTVSTCFLLTFGAIFAAVVFPVAGTYSQ